MTSRTDNMHDGNSRAVYMKKYRKRKRFNCNNIPKRTKIHAEREREYRETHKALSAEYMRKAKLRKTKTPESSTLTDPTPTPIMYNYNQATEYFKSIVLVIHLVMPTTYVIDYCIRTI
jgi:hypothetical protein